MSDITDVESVKRVTRLTNELSQSEFQEFIEDVESDILMEYGPSQDRINSIIDTDIGSYYIAEDFTPIYKIKQVKLDGSVLNIGSYVVNKQKGSVALTADLLSDYEGSRIVIDYVSKSMHNLATAMAGVDCLESQYLVSNEGGEFPRTQSLKRMKERAQMVMMRENMVRSGKYASWNPALGKTVSQLFLGNER